MKQSTIFLFFAFTLQVSGQHYWMHSFGPDFRENVSKVIGSKDGGWITAGYSEGFGNSLTNVHIIKWDSDGEISWQHVFGGSANEYAFGVTEDNAGNIYVTGKTNAPGTSGGYDILFLKFNSSGEELWARNIGGTFDDFANSIIVSGSNKIIMAGGTSSSGAGGKDGYLIETDTAGNIVWTKTFGTSGDEYINSISQLQDGGYLLGGKTSGYGNNHGYVVRTDSAGDTLWTNAYDIGLLSASEIFDAIELPGNGFVYTGYGNDYSYGNMFHMKTDVNGNLSYVRTSNYLADGGYDLAAMDDGGYMVCGYYSNYGTYPVLTRFDSSGTKIWERIFLHSSGSRGYPVYGDGRTFVRNDDGSFVIAGENYLICNIQKGIIMHLDSEANPIAAPGFGITSSAGFIFCDSASVYTLLSADGGFEHYQWVKNATVIDGATAQTYLVTEAGSYACLVGYSEGFSYSPQVLIAVQPASFKPEISPSGIVSRCLTNGSLHLLALSGPPYLQYQWSFNGNIIPGATNYFYDATQDGFYAVTKYNTCDTATSDTVSVFLSRGPQNLEVYSSHGLDLCSASGQATSFSIIGESTMGTYAWILNDTGIISTDFSCYPTVEGNYKVVVSNACGTDTSDAVTLNLNSPPVAPISSTGNSSLTVFTDNGTNYYCGHDTLRTENIYPATYSWKKDGIALGNNSWTIVISNPGSYTVTVSDSCGSVTSSPFIVTADTGNNSLAVINSSSCSMFQLSAPMSGPYQWYMNNSPLTFYTSQNYSTSYPGNYYCTFQPAVCNYPIPSNTVSLSAALGWPIIQATPSTHVCSGNILLTVNHAGGLYQWKRDNSNIQGATNQSYSASQSGLYFCIVTLPGCIPDSAQSMISIGNATISSNITVVCPSYGTWLSISGGYYMSQIQWRLNGININGANSTNYNATQGGIYDCTITDSCGTYQTNAISLSAFPIPAEISPSGIIPLCDGSSAILDATFLPGSTYQWLFDGDIIPGATDSVFLASPEIRSLGGASIYLISVRIKNSGCNITTQPDSILLNHNFVNNIYPSSSPEWCSTGSVQLNARTVSNILLQWFMDSLPIPGATDTLYTASNPGNYYVYLYDSIGCGYNSNTISVRNDAISGSIYSTGQLAFCEGSSVMLTLNPPAASYQWYKNGNLIPGATMQNYTADTTALYNVSFADTSGCSGESGTITQLVASNHYPIYSATRHGCIGDSVFMQTNRSGQWYRDGIPLTAGMVCCIYANISGNYYQVIPESYGCNSYTDTIEMIFDSLQTASITSSATSLCNVPSINLRANYNPANQYQWKIDGLDIPGAVYFTYEAYGAGTYTCEVTGTCGTAISNAITITAPFTVNITAGGPTSFCTGDSVELNTMSTSGFSYQWRNYFSNVPGATENIYVATASGCYYVVLIDSNGCMNASNFITVDVGSTPHASITASNAYLCGGSPVNLTAVSPMQLSYQWMFNGVAIPGATNSNFTAASIGNYQCAVFNMCGNTVTDSITIADGTATVDLGSDTTLCVGESILVDAGPAHSSYFWQDGSTMQTFTCSSAIADTLVIFVTVTDITGCSSQDSVVVFYQNCTEISVTLRINSIEIYPNPSHTSFILSCPGFSGTMRLSILSPLGEVVYLDNLSGSESHMIRPQLSQGIYFLIVGINKQSIVKKLVIQ